MLSLIRRNLRGKLFQVILWATVISMAVGAFSMQTLLKRLKSGMDESTVALVNGLPISITELRNRSRHHEQQIAYYRQQLGPQADQLLRAFGMSTNPEEAAMYDLINERVQDGVANKIKLAVAPSAVIEHLQDPVVLARELGALNSLVDNKTGKINMALLKQFLTSNRMSVHDLEKLMEEGLRRGTVLDIARSAVFVPDFLINPELIKQNSSNNYTILKFPIEMYVKHVASPTQAELEEFFQEQNKRNAYQIAEKRSGKLWKFLPENFDVAINDAEIVRYYNLNKKDFFVPAPEAGQAGSYKPLDQVRQEIRDVLAQENFKKVFMTQASGLQQEIRTDEQALERFAESKKASMSSVADMSAKSGDRTVQELFKVAALGEFGVYINDNAGYIVKLDKITPAATPELASVKKQVVADYTNKKAYALMQQAVQDALAKITPENIAQIGQEFKAAVDKVGPLRLSDTEEIARLEKEGIPAQVFGRLKKEGQFEKEFAPTAGFIIELTKTTLPNEQEYAQQKQQLLKSKYAELERLATHGFVASLSKNATINSKITY